MPETSILKPDKWVQMYADALFSYAKARISDSGIAEDLVQETFLSAWKAKDGYKGEASEKNWLFAICKNKIIDHYRKKAKDVIQYGEGDSSSLFFDEEEHWTNESAPKDWDLDIKQPLESKEFYKILEYCKNKLQELQQSVFILKFMEGVETAEICKVLNISPSNYWVLIHRAKLQLRSCLEKNWVNQS